MPAHRYFVGVLALVVLAGCGFIGRTPAPTLTSAPTLSAISTMTLAPSASATEPTWPPTADPSMPPAQTPTPSVVGTPAAIWQRTVDFPPRGAVVRSITTGPQGFVAVGAATEQYECDASADGRIWTSADGQRWTEFAQDTVREVDLGEVVSTATAVYAFGHAHSWYCTDQLLVLRSEDGVSWDRRVTTVPDNAYFGEIAASGDTLFAAGDYEEDGFVHAALWTSTDGIDWRRLEEPPVPYLDFRQLVSLQDTVVAIEDYGPNVAWQSSDGGQTWKQSEFVPLYEAGIAQAASGNGIVVAAGGACCTVPGTNAGFTFTTTDGRTWIESSMFRHIPNAIIALPGGFLTIGSENWVSHDGLHWTVGPQLPDYDPQSDLVAASSPSSVFVLNGDVSWFASTQDIDVEAWSKTPAPAQMPEIGVPYRVDLFLHCGWPDIHFGLRPWVPEPPIDDVNAPPGFGEEDRGWLTQISANELRYESRHGPTLTLTPSDRPQSSGPCA